MALRKASAYSKKKVVPYTRKSNVQKKSFIKTVPPSKIVKFEMGDKAGYEKGKFKYSLKMMSTEKVIIRDNSLEACRLVIYKVLEKNIPGQYFFAIKVHPHHILRENKMLTGAGADRMQSGMQLSFGKTMGRGAIVNPGAEVFLIAIHSKKDVDITRKAIKSVRTKLPCKIKVIFEERGKK